VHYKAFSSTALQRSANGVLIYYNIQQNFTYDLETKNNSFKRHSYRSNTSAVCSSSISCNPPSTRLLGRWLGLGRRLGRLRLWWLGRALGRLGLVNSLSFFYFFYFYDDLADMV
jgi:hypothetical protein